MSNATMHDREDQDPEREPQTDEATSNDGDDNDAPVPFAPDSDEDGALGDTDEHSDA